MAPWTRCGRHATRPGLDWSALRLASVVIGQRVRFSQVYYDPDTADADAVLCNQLYASG